MTNLASRGPAIEFDHASFWLNGRPILNQVSFSVQAGETLALLGRSGSGKTTALKLINGLRLPTGGEVRVHGRRTSEWDPIRLRRSIGYVMQEGGLFPHFSVEKNIGLVPRIEGWEERRVRDRVSELLETVRLNGDVVSRYPGELSGGQRQRVGIARALAADPPILIMDEAFSALDPITRAEMQKEFLELQQRVRKAVVFVTHDLREAMLLGDRIALLEDGHLVANLTPAEFPDSQSPIVRAYVQAFSDPMAKRRSA